MLKRLVKRFKKTSPHAKNTAQPTIIPRAEHSISRSNIHRNALKVLYRLHSAGYGAYLVGGCVRDLLLDRHPKDFDIATNAHPEEVRKLFKNSRLIGKRFRLAHIVFGKEIVEVATFRTHHENANQEQHAKTHQGMILRDNVYGTIENDVLRRDFTLNGLYYNIADFSVVDYINGMQDIQTRTIRMIGNAEERYHEDPVRLLRAIRFMGKLNLTISPETEEPIIRLRHLLQKVSSARLFLEVSKLFQEGATLPTFHLLRKYQLLDELFPGIQASLQNTRALHFLEQALSNTDQRVKEQKSVSPAFILSVLIWPLATDYLEKLNDTKLPPYVAHEKAVFQASTDLTERLAIPRTLLAIIREICLLQFRFTQRFGSRTYRLMSHPRFRAAYDLLLLRASAGEQIKEVSEWWTVFCDADETKRDEMVKAIEKSSNVKFKKKRKKKKIKSTGLN
jgi:poly(A) polymerase